MLKSANHAESTFVSTSLQKYEAASSIATYSTGSPWCSKNAATASLASAIEKSSMMTHPPT